MVPQENQLDQTKNDTTLQHYRVTLQTARRHYEAGHVTATGLIYFAIAIKRKPGWRLSMTAEMVEKELGVKKSAFYNAISQLKADGWIEWEAPEGINAWIPVMDSATKTITHSQQDTVSANAENFPQPRKTFRNRGKLSATAENQPPKAFQDASCESSPDINQIFIKSSTTELVAAATEKSLKEDLWDEQLPAEEGQDRPVESDNLSHPTEMVEGAEGIEREIGGEPEPNSEGKCSAVQLEALKKLGLTLSYGFKAQLEDASSEEVDRAIACFQKDKATWTAGEMNNPTGYFIKVIRQVREGRQPEQRSESEIDPIDAALELWRKRWEECLPMQRPMLLRDIRIGFSGKIDVLDPDQGPVRI